MSEEELKERKWLINNFPKNPKLEFNDKSSLYNQ